MNNLKKLRNSKKLTVRELAELIGINYATINRLENGDSQFNNDYIQIFTNFFGVSADYLLGLPQNIIPIGDGTFKLVPILGHVHAGTPSEMLANNIGHLQAKVVNVDDYFYLQVKGDSMYPTFEDGDYVLVKFQKHAENNQIVVAGLNGDEATVKRYKKIGSDTFLFADNKNYEPIKLCEELDPYIVGVVKGLFRTEFK